MKGSIFDIQRYSVHDGPGIRTLIFLKGCMLRCQWCSNPESQNLNNEIMLMDEECIGIDKCGLCISTCEHNAIYQKDNKAFIKRELCEGCGNCSVKCPCDAIRSTNRIMSVQEITDYVMKDIDFYNRSGGGVTLSGGEPLFQYEFCLDLLKSLKKKKLHTALETTACYSWEKLKNIIQYADLFLIDIKHMNSSEHEKYTGVGNSLILKNLKKLSKEKAKIEIRIPLIPGINDQLDNLLRTGEFVKNELGLKKITLLPYHRLGQTKYEQLGKDYMLEAIQPIKLNSHNEYMETRKQVLRNLDLDVR